MTPRQRAVAHLLANNTVSEAAEAGGVSDAKVRGWLRESEEFRAEVARAVGEEADTARRLAQHVIRLAAQYLRDKLGAAEADPKIAVEILDKASLLENDVGTDALTDFLTGLDPGYEAAYKAVREAGYVGY